MTKPDKFQVIRIAIAIDHYINYMNTNDMSYLDLYANVKSGLFREGIDFNTIEIVKQYKQSKNK